MPNAQLTNPHAPITRKRIIDWAGRQILKDAEAIVKDGLVLRAEYDPPLIKGVLLHNNREFKTSLTILKDGNVENNCPCYSNKERGIICAHVIALALSLVNRAADPEREAKYKEEIRRAARLNAIDESNYITRATDDTPGAMPASVEITLEQNWKEGYLLNSVTVSCAARYRKQSRPLDEVPADIPLLLNKKDESILFVLEDISEGPAKSTINLSKRDFLNIVRLHSGRSILVSESTEIAVHDTPMTTFLKMDLDKENGELILDLHTELPFMHPGEMPFYVVAGRIGWVYGAGHFWPLESLLPEPYHSIYQKPIIVTRPNVLRFVKQELPLLSKQSRVETDISLDLFSIAPASPAFRLVVRGSPASLSGVLYAQYGEAELVAGKPDIRGNFAIPDPDDLMRYTGRNKAAEEKALQLLSQSGMTGVAGDDLDSIIGSRDVLNFLGKDLPALKRRGWQVELHGRVAPHFEKMSFATPVVQISDSGGGKWFDVGFGFEGDGASISNADIQLALRKGDSFISSRGRTMLIDAEAVDSMMNTFSDCATEDSSEPGHFRLPGIYAPFIKSSLDSLDGIDVEDTPEWRTKAERSNRTMRVESVELKPPLDTLMRPYQKEGVNWLRFLEKNGFCGILADEMGLGKTLQALAWLQIERAEAEATEKPALVVCPTSIVENWAEETAKYAPDMKVLVLSGSDRHEKWDDITEADLVITSYALLRRDIEKHEELEFSTAVLDEAQHIKNRSTRNALAAKKIRAHNKLVLTGTPVENGVSDIWSIMDFLMPGYLGGHDIFRTNYELPISRGGPEAELAQSKLRKKLHPFLLRRLKKDVAKDLPPKIERVSSTPLSADQAAVYKQILKNSQQKIKNLVA
ncbi:hypothetical protein H8D64_00525, partial [PVC group bacterium]|nr:hypothetical protein [PVC group bacterium]